MLESMSSFLGGLSNVFDTFGASVSVPVIIFIIALVFKAKPGKAFRSALLAGVALTGFSLLINAYMPTISGIVDKMVLNTGVSLPVLDVGWQACALVAYSTQIGMAFLLVAIVLQVVLFVTKWTDIFMPSDLWNTYSFMLWGSTLYLATNNVWLSMGLMILMNLYVLLFAEVLAPCFSSYYNYPGCAITAPHHAEGVPFYVLVNFIMNKLGFNKINLNLENVQKKLGLFGEPMVLGLIIGFILGFVGNFHELGTLAAWGEIATAAISTAAVMAIFPKIASLFAAAFTLLTEATKGIAKKHGKGRNWYLSVNDATGYGEPATIMVGTLMIPIMLILAFVLPGNRALIMVDLIAMPYCMIPMISISKGNMFKTLVGTILYFSLSLYVWGWMAELYTSVAVGVGFELTSATMLITCTCFMPFLAMLFGLFLTQNPILIGLTVVVYFVLYFLFRKYKDAIINYMLTCNDIKDAQQVTA